MIETRFWQYLKYAFPRPLSRVLRGLYPRSAGKRYSLDTGHCINVGDIRISWLFKGNSNQLVNSDNRQPIESYADFSFCKTELRIFKLLRQSIQMHCSPGFHVIIQSDQKVSVHICTVIVRCTEIFWSPCSTAHGYKQFQGPCCLHLLPRRRWEFLHNCTSSHLRKPWSRHHTLQGDAARNYWLVCSTAKCEYFTKKPIFLHVLAPFPTFLDFSGTTGVGGTGTNQIKERPHSPLTISQGFPLLKHHATKVHSGTWW